MASNVKGDTCAGNCHGHGNCVDNKCECIIPYFGSSCQESKQ